MALNTEFYAIPVPGEGGWRKVVKDYRPVQQHLRRLIKQWRDSGPNVANLLASDPGLAQEIGAFRAILLPTQGGFARLTYDTDLKSVKVGDPLDTALGLFLAFLLNPNNSFLSGPCKHCQRYFVRKNNRDRVYCSKKCGLRHTARETVWKKRAEEKEDKLRRVIVALKGFRLPARAKCWKDVIAVRAGVSKNWITRAVKRGDILPPAGM